MNWGVYRTHDAVAIVAGTFERVGIGNKVFQGPCKRIFMAGNIHAYEAAARVQLIESLDNDIAYHEQRLDQLRSQRAEVQGDPGEEP